MPKTIAMINIRKAAYKQAGQVRDVLDKEANKIPFLMRRNIYDRIHKLTKIRIKLFDTGDVDLF